MAAKIRILDPAVASDSRQRSAINIGKPGGRGLRLGYGAASLTAATARAGFLLFVPPSSINAHRSDPTCACLVVCQNCHADQHRSVSSEKKQHPETVRQMGSSNEGSLYLLLKLDRAMALPFSFMRGAIQTCRRR